jgi:hypothetical protein
MLKRIVDALADVNTTARDFLDVTRDRKGTEISDNCYRDWECSVAELRRQMDKAGCFKMPRHQLYQTDREQKVYDALRTLAREVGEDVNTPLVASALPPLPSEGATARLDKVLMLLQEYVSPPRETADDGPLLTSLQMKIMAALWKLKATNKDRRQTRKELLPEVDRNTSVDSLKEPLADLKRFGYSCSARGCDGGCWLTQAGIDRAKKLKKVRKR